jgi:hypothetical protein
MLTYDVKIVYFLQYIEYRRHGLRHRLDGPAAIGQAGGTIWGQYGEYHRDNGPAISYLTSEYYKRGVHYVP